MAITPFSRTTNSLDTAVSGPMAVLQDSATADVTLTGRAGFGLRPRRSVRFSPVTGRQASQALPCCPRQDPANAMIRSRSWLLRAKATHDRE
jgi:hypothetical protein